MTTAITPVKGYSFLPEHLQAETRKPGISAFMRIRDGEDFLEPTIRSHINYFDEIVAVYNQCTDRTEEILLELHKEFPDKLRLFHYLDRVYPPGSAAHAETPADSPNSLVNYYNFSLAQTRYKVATKLDDDHIAIEAQLARIISSIRERNYMLDEILCFSGPNLYRDGNSVIGLYPNDIISGRGDIGFFPVRENMFFTHDRRYEKSPRLGLHRKFVGFLYFHLKYLKKGSGFANYELDQNPDSRYSKKKKALETYPAAMSFQEAAERIYPKPWKLLLALLFEKEKILKDQGKAFKEMVDAGNFSEDIIHSIYNQLKISNI